jgi:hypothetical protein
MPQAQEEDTTKCSQHGNNCIQLLVIDVEGHVRAMIDLMEWIIHISYGMENRSVSFVANP